MNNNNKKNVTIDQAQAVDGHIKANRSTATVWQRIGKVFTTKVIPLLLVLILVIMPTVLVACNFVPDDPDKDDSGIVKPGDDNDNQDGDTDNDSGNTDSDQGGNTGGQDGDADQGGEQGGNESGDGNQGGQDGDGNEGGEQGGEDGDQGETEIKPEPVDDLDDLYMAKPDASNYTNGTEDTQYIADMQKYQNAQELKKTVYTTLNTYLLDKMVSKASGNTSDVAKVSNVKWQLVSEDKVNIDRIVVSFNSNFSETRITYYIESVTPKTGTTVTLDDLFNPVEETLDNAFDTTRYVGAKYYPDCVFSYETTDQENTYYNKIKNALIANGTLPQEDENTEILIKYTGGSTNPNMGPSSNYTFLVKTNNSATTIPITIKNGAFGDDILTEKEYHINSIFIEEVSYPEQVLDESVLTA